MTDAGRLFLLIHLEAEVLKFIKKSIESKRVNLEFSTTKMKQPLEEIVITNVNERTLFFNS
jgi:hypothetical protein